MNLPAAILFDLDGTLVDTDPLWNAAERDLLVTAGGKWNAETTKKLIGVNMEEGARIIRRETGLEWSVEKINRHLVQAMIHKLRGHVPWNEGMPEFLAAMRSRGVPCYIVTSSYREMAEMLVLDQPPGTFAGIVAGDEVVNTKPHPEPYLTACRLAGAAPEECLAVEDSPTGVASAVAAGVVTVAIAGRLAVPGGTGVSRIASSAELTPAFVSRLMAGEVIDAL